MSLVSHCLPVAAPRARWMVPLLVALTGALFFPTLARADAKSALPPAVGTFKLTKPPVIYTPANLEMHIDGEAEAVKRFDFRQCAYAEYAPGGKGNQLITVDIFQMGSPQDAYGFYSGQRNPGAKFLKIGAEGYQEQTALNFWKGPYYVRTTITAAGAPAAFQQEMPKIAQAVAAKLTGTTAPPPIVGLLPPGYAPRTEAYSRSNVAAQSYIKNGVTAKYPSAGPQAEAFVAVFPSPAQAKQAFTQYQAYLTKPINVAVGAKPAPLKGLGDSALGIKTRFSGEVVTAVKGKYLIIVRKAKSPANAQALVKAALARAK